MPKTIESGQFVDDEITPPLPHDEYTEEWRKNAEAERLKQAGSRKASAKAKAETLASLPATGGGDASAGVPDGASADPIAEGNAPADKGKRK